MSNFKNKTVMITGAGGAIAQGVVARFARAGANLVLVDRHTEAVQDTLDMLGDIDGEALVVGGDLGQPEDVDAIIAQAEEKFGTIDALAHIAGGFTMGKPVHETEIGVFEKMMYLNPRLTWVTLGRVAKHMVEKGVQGSLVTIIARPAQGGAKNMAAYVASKAATERIMQSMALELKEHGIRVNGVSPSIADTPANRKDMPNADFEKWVSPLQIGDAILFLASPAAEAISGQTLGVYNKV